MNADLLLRHLGELWSQDAPPPVHGAAMGQVTVLRDAFLAVKDGKVVGRGVGDGTAWIGSDTTVVDGGGNVLVPGFIDGHTHLVHAGSREDEFARKLAGESYLDILAAGGGILSTVAKTRAASAAELTLQARRSLERMLLAGVVAVEAKSGYGLDLTTELRQLAVARDLARSQPVAIVSTAMAAHAVPAEYAGRREAYVDRVVADLAAVKASGLADGVDVFCEEGVFTPADAERILTRAKELGFAVRIHADELASTGGAGLAVRLGCASADHLGRIAAADIPALAASDVVADLLPGTSFFLGEPYAPARRLLDAGCAVAVASDYNPGSSPSENFLFILQLAAGKLRMTPAEVLTAATANAAFHLGLSDRLGALVPGKDASFVLLEARNFPYVLYHYAVNHVKDVYIQGRRVVADGRILKEETT